MSVAEVCPLPECDFCGDIESHLADAHQLTASGVPSQLATLTQNLKRPWWDGAGAGPVLGDDDAIGVSEVLELPLNIGQYQVAHYRYKKYLHSAQLQLVLGTDIHNQVKTYVRKYDELERGRELEKTSESALAANADATTVAKRLYTRPPRENLEAMNPEQLEQYFLALTNRYHTACKINDVIANELEGAVRIKRKQYLINQMLLDANIDIGLPPEPSDIPERVHRDQLDHALLDRP